MDFTKEQELFLEEKFSTIDERHSHISERLEHAGKVFEVILRNQDSLIEVVKDINNRLENVEKKVDKLHGVQVPDIENKLEEMSKDIKDIDAATGFKGIMSNEKLTSKEVN